MLFSSGEDIIASIFRSRRRKRSRRAGAGVGLAACDDDLKSKSLGLFDLLVGVQIKNSYSFSLKGKL